MSAFEFSPEQLRERLEEIVDETFDDLQSQFLVLPRGGSYLEYPSFQDAYEVSEVWCPGFAGSAKAAAFIIFPSPGFASTSA